LVEPRQAERLVTDLASGDAAQRFDLEGRVLVKSGEQQYSGGLTWDRRDPAEPLFLTTPLGQGIAEIRRDKGLIVLVDGEGRRQEADDVDSLASRVFGAPIPIAGLVYWLSARPRPGVPHVAHMDRDGRVTRLEQDGWRIDYDRYREAGNRWLPARLFATRADGIEFRLIVDKWEAQ
jgi:outer membrane lipoprotein LolB